MPKRAPAIDIHSLSFAELELLVGGHEPPPVEQWNPPNCGHSDMRIARDGTWYYRGSPIQRPEMVRLFSTILRREPDGRHVLVTPFEMLEIDVESTPLRVVELRSEGDGIERKIAFRLNNGDILLLDASHPLRIVDSPAGPSPRITVRGGIEAELSRSVYYVIVELAFENEGDPPGFWSSGTYFPLEGSK